MQEEMFYPLNHIEGCSVFAKSNMVIRSRFSSSLLAEQVFNYICASLKESDIEGRDNLAFCFPVSEIKKLLGKNSGSIYNRLKDAAMEIGSRYIMCEDTQNDSFVYVNIISKAEYNNGQIKFCLNRDAIPYILYLKGNFTKLTARDSFLFSSFYSLRLYEILWSAYKQERAYQKSPFHKPVFVFCDYARLLFDLGVADTSDIGVRDYFKKTRISDVNYEEAAKRSYKPIDSSWTNVRDRIIKRAITEINEKTELNVSFEPKRTGKGGKITGIVFSCEGKDEAKTKASSSEPDILLKILADMLEAGYEITLGDAKKIAAAADNDSYRIYAAINILKSSAGHINDPVSYVLSAVKEEYIASKPQLQRLRESGEFSMPCV